MNGYIYGLECPLKKEIVYIGQTHHNFNYRLTEHISLTKTKIKYGRVFNKKEHWIKKLIRLNIENEIKIILIEECDINIIDEREIYWIAEYSKTRILKNLSPGGNSNRGFKFSDVRKKKMSEDAKERYKNQTEEEKINIINRLKEYRKNQTREEKINIINKLKNNYTKEKRKIVSDRMIEYYKTHDATFLNKKHSEESRKKISINRKGKCKGEHHIFYGTHRSEETKQKISNKVKGENHPLYGTHRSDITKNKISEANSGENNGMYGKHLKKTPEQIEKQRINMINSENFQKSRKSKEFRDKISEAFSIPIYILDDNFNILIEFKNTRECGEYYGCTRGNVKNAIRDLRKIMKKYWVVRKENYLESINKIKQKLDEHKS